MSVPIQWRTKKQRYSLQGSVCPKCQSVVFPPRGACPHCSREHESDFGAASLVSREHEAPVHPLVFAIPVLAESATTTVAGDD